MSMFNDISWGSRDNEKECESNARLVSLYAKTGQWSFLGLCSEKKWYSISADSPQSEWDRIAEKMMLQFGESRHPVFCAKSPLSRGQLKSKGGGKLSIHFAADGGTIETVFCTVISVNQLSIYGAVSEMCEEYETFHDRTGQPVVGGQSSSSFVPSVIKKEVLLDCDDRARKDPLLQQYGERIEKLSQQDRVRKFCIVPDHNWSRTVFHDERHWTSLTIHRCSGLSWVHLAKRRRFIWTKRLDQTEYQNWFHTGSCNLLFARQIWSWDQNHVDEQRQFSLLGQNFSWLTSWSRIWTTMSRKPQKCSWKNMRWNWMRVILHANAIKGQSKTTKTYFCQLIHKNNTYWGKNLDRCWTTRNSISDYAVSKKLIYLLRHGRPPREDDGAIEFWRIKVDLQKHFLLCHHWSDDKWKSMGRRRNQEKITVLHWFIRSNSLPPSSSRSFRTQSYWSFITGQCGDSEQLLPAHLSCRMCNQVTFIINSGLIPGGQNLSNRQTVFITSVDLMNKESQGSWYDRLECTASCTIHA